MPGNRDQEFAEVRMAIIYPGGRELDGGIFLNGFKVPSPGSNARRRSWEKCKIRRLEEEQFMLVRFFLNEPNGKAGGRFLEMMPRLSAKYEIAIEIIAKHRAEYQTDSWFQKKF